MGSTPKSPDPYATANAQTNANITAGQASAVMNNPDQYGPGGSRVTQQTGWQQIYDPNSGRMINAPKYKETTKLSPDEQRIYGLNTQGRYNLGQIGVEQSSKVRGLLNKNLDTSGMQGWSTAAAPGQVRQDQGPTDRAAIENAMMASYNRQTAPREAAQQAQLAARGLSPGSQGYGTVQQGQEDAHGEAARQAYLASGQESRAAQGAYNQAALQRYQMGSDYSSQLNNLRQGQLQERMALRNQPLNEITALMGGSQVNMPQFSPFSRQGINAPDIGGYINQNYANQLNQSQNQMSGMFGLGSAAISGLFGL